MLEKHLKRLFDIMKVCLHTTHWRYCGEPIRCNIGGQDHAYLHIAYVYIHIYVIQGWRNDEYLVLEILRVLLVWYQVQVRSTVLLLQGTSTALFLGLVHTYLSSCEITSRPTVVARLTAVEPSTLSDDAPDCWPNDTFKARTKSNERHFCMQWEDGTQWIFKVFWRSQDVQYLW